MEKFYKVNFKVKLIKFLLAFKAECQINVFWKKGEKIAESSQVSFSGGIANFDESLSIYCNMIFSAEEKKIQIEDCKAIVNQTKFEIILYTEKGTKKVGEIRFDVSGYLNERLKKGKLYQISLQKCPDKNAKLSFQLSAVIQKEVSLDNISQRSVNTVNIESLVQNASEMSRIHSNSMIQKEKDVVKEVKPKQIEKKIVKDPASQNNPDAQQIGSEKVGERIKFLQSQNRKIKEQLKNKDKLLKQNEELKKKIKNEQYDNLKELKQKIESGRRELERLQGMVKRQVLLQKEVRGIEQQIFRCKYQIMNAFNYANERGGGKLLFEMQEACGLRET